MGPELNIEEAIMLKIHASYSKKVPTSEKFSTQSYMASVEAELAHGLSAAELQAKIAEAFAVVKQSVQKEIEAARPMTGSVGRTDTPADPPTHRKEPARITHKQIAFLIALGHKRHLAITELNEMAQTYGANSIHELTRKNASALVDKLNASVAA